MTYDTPNPSEIWTEMVKVANADPDFVYKSQGGMTCGYAGMDGGYSDGRGCLVGQALANLGYTTEELLELDEVGAANYVLRMFGFDPNGFISFAIARAQGEQDRGSSWAEAIDKARDLSKSYTAVPNEWEIILGITVLDPDGWDRQNFAEDWGKPLSYDEFWAKAGMSTIRVNR